MSEKLRGRCKWFKAEKGFGFIQREDGRGDVFVHHTQIVADGFRTLNEGDVVEFSIEKHEKGDRAVGVMKVG